MCLDCPTMSRPERIARHAKFKDNNPVWAMSLRRTMILERPPEGSPCELCGRTDRLLTWNHDHTTGHHRGWLCQGCNTGLGGLGDTVEDLERALAYLRRQST
jgi:hypothetical protein